MKTIEKVSNKDFFYNDLELNIKYYYSNWKIWLTKKDISKIFRFEKSFVKSRLDSLIVDNFIYDQVAQSVYDRVIWKTKTYYSLDLMILFWYWLKSYEETKFLIKTNKMINRYILPSKIKFILLYIAWIYNIIFSTLKYWMKTIFA